MLLQWQGPWACCYRRWHPAWLLAGPGGDKDIVYAPEFKIQKGRELYFTLTFSNSIVN